MLRFRIWRIPVEVHPGHFLVAALLGYQGLNWQRDSGGATLLLLSWIAIVFFSVLLHELGHALAFRAFGYRPRIELVWTGGLTHPNAGAPLPWHKDVLVTLAGPVSGLLFGGAIYLIDQSAPASSVYLAKVIGYLKWVNVGWSVINLAPISPMDGGRIANVVLIRLFGRRGFLLAQLISLGLCVVLFALLAASPGGSYLIILVVIFGLRAVGGVSAYFRGEIPDPNSPALIPFSNAQNLYRQDQLPAAKQLAEQALEAATFDPKLRSRIHHLLGWIAVKEGNGRAALDHFSLAEGLAIEPHALAAAYSLVGDDARALELWKVAYEQSRDPTVLHEWAGALIRDDRTADARKLPGVDMSLAYTCAERVLFIRGEFDAAARVGLAALEEHPSAETAYDVACAMARAGDSEGALRLLDRAAELGFRKRSIAQVDPDLSSLHGDLRFKAWLNRLDNSDAR